MIYLRNYIEYSQLAGYQPGSKLLMVVNNDHKIPDTDISGFYYLCIDNFISIYAFENSIHISGFDVDFTIDKSYKSKVTKIANNGYHELTLFIDSNEIYKWRYVVPQGDIIDYFRFHDNDDYDIGVLVTDLLDSDQAREIFIEANHGRK